VGLERQIEEMAARSDVDVLARFECPAPFWACAAEMDEKTAEAFSRAMEQLRDLLVLRSLPDDPDQPEGFERTTAAEYITLESAQVEVARFTSNAPEKL
jgi:hypothetical protein